MQEPKAVWVFITEIICLSTDQSFIYKYIFFIHPV